MLPHEQAVAVEDIDSVVILWDAVPGGQKGFDGTFGYVQAQRLDFDRFIVLPFGDTAAIEELRQTVAHWDNTLKIDYGMVMDTAHDPGRGPTGFLGGICPFLSYVVDPEMGTTTNERRNPEILNQMFSQFPGWQNYAVLAKPYFSERYVKETQSAVIEALHQYALMTK